MEVSTQLIFLIMLPTWTDRQDDPFNSHSWLHDGGDKTCSRFILKQKHLINQSLSQSFPAQVTTDPLAIKKIKIHMHYWSSFMIHGHVLVYNVIYAPCWDVVYTNQEFSLKSGTLQNNFHQVLH